MTKKRKAISRGSLIAVRKRTIDNAPTIPSERTTFDVTARISTFVIIVRAISVTPNEDEYITPLYVFLYTIKINKPMAKDKTSVIIISKILTLPTFSKKLDLKISLKFI